MYWFSVEYWLGIPIWEKGTKTVMYYPIQNATHEANHWTFLMPSQNLSSIKINLPLFGHSC